MLWKWREFLPIITVGEYWYTVSLGRAHMNTRREKKKKKKKKKKSRNKIIRRKGPNLLYTSAAVVTALLLVSIPGKTLPAIRLFLFCSTNSFLVSPLLLRGI
jgi:hypothetical protein